MKINFSILLLIFGALLHQPAKSQPTTLSGGDIAFLGINSDGNDEFAFMILKNINSGTTITFTDHQWLLSGGFSENLSFGACNTEAFMTWTTTSPLTLGTIVVISNPGGAAPSASMATASTGTLAVQGSCPDFSFSIASTGETLFAYQGAKPTTNAATNWIAAINYCGVWAGGNTVSSTTSEKPTNLSNSHILMVSAHIDNIVYKGALSGTAPQLLAAINNYSNWQSNDITPYSFPADIGSGGTLPVKLISFEALAQPEQVLLKWKTAFEQNSSSFIIQHSKDGVDFNNIGTVAAAGNSFSELNYSFTHTQPIAGHNYYRLLQTDLDGKNSYSDIRQSHYQPGKKTFTILTNKIENDQLNVHFFEKNTLLIFNSNAKQVLKKQMLPGLNIIPVSNLSKGVYIVQSGNSTQKILIQ
jgi:hypothetical protein